MIEKLAGAAAEVGKTAVEGFGKAFDPDKRLDTQKSPEKIGKSSESVDLDKRMEKRNSDCDDNGKAYKKNDELLPNNTYELNGYRYRTDDHGRITSAEGKLYLKDGPGYDGIKSSATMEKIGKGDQKAGDQRGHEIPNRFGGAGDIGNLTPQDAKLNQGALNRFEGQLADMVASGKDVYLKINTHYDKDSHRPSSYTYRYTVDGKTRQKTFKNGVA